MTKFDKMKRSLALLGHSKLKGALRHTLLLIGCMLMSLGAFAQVDPANPNIPNGLVMNKYFVPDDPNNGTSGNIFLETYVTGRSVAQHVPTDIVLVLDVSGSMDDMIYDYEYTARSSQSYTYWNYGNNAYYYKHTDGQYYQVSRGDVWDYNNDWYHYYYLSFTVNNTTYYLSGTGVTTTRPSNVQNQNTTIWTGVLYEREAVSSQSKMAALKTSVKLFVDIIAEDAEQHEVDHTISIVKYAGNRYYNANSNSDDPTTAPNAANLAEGNHTYRSGGYTYNYTEVLINHRSPTDASYGATYIKNQVDALNAGGATSADFGMYKAKLLLQSFPEPEEGEPERSKVVVMFTDGEPNHNNGFNTDVANDVISFAHDMKHDLNATVFTVGVFGDNIDDRTDDYMSYTSSNYPDATDLDNGGDQASTEYYFEASSSGGLADIFEAIAGASGAMSLPDATIVQDAVSTNFKLPNGANDVTAYAPKYYKDTDGTYKFEALNDNGTLEIGNTTDPETGETITGAVIGGGENRLPASFVSAENGIIQMEGFNFSHHWVGTVVDDDETETAHGRKIVIKIHIELADAGAWGDGIATNVPANSYIQAPDPEHPGQYVYYGPFPPTSANVMGSVWTEVVRTKPAGFPTITGNGAGQTVEIDSPEDLAWFISEVNGRIGYNVHEGEDNTNIVASHPKLNGKLMADIDMSAHNWVPIGSGWQVELKADGTTQFITGEDGKKVHMTYEGTFDGNGHVITGLKNNASKFYKVIEGGSNAGVVVFPGMFSDVSGTIKNVFVLDADFRGKNRGDDEFIHHGIIADTLEAGGLIFNCEAAGRITCNNDPGNPDYNPTMDQKLKYGGLVGLNRGTIHSCMAMAELSGYTMGGMIAENEGAGKFSNGFTNGVFHYFGTLAGAENKPVAGIVAINPTAANVSNCYVRFSRESSGLDQTTGFRQIAGLNSFDAETCYSPSRTEHTEEVLTVNTAWNQSIPSNGFGIDYTNTRNQSRMREDRSNDNMVGGTWETKGEGENAYKILNGGTSLLKKLNAGVASGQASWKRTTAIGSEYNLQTSPNGGNINGDYPILEFTDYNCVASADGIRLDYAATLDQMLDRHNTGNMNQNTALGNSYKVAGNETIYGGAINLYANDDNVTKSTMSATSKDGETVSTVVYIDEKVSLLQGDGSNIEAYTGQTIKDFGSSYDEDGVRWHNVSSSLSGSKFGWTYGIETSVAHNWDPNPCVINLNVSNDDEALFPTDARSFNVIDFYCFYEPQYHWINFKRNSNSHWHMESPETQIIYDNEDHFYPGKGYLMALYTEYFADRHLWNDNNDGSKNGQFIQNRGTLNNGTITIPVTNTPINDQLGYNTGRTGYNLLGNPYQSYLDFEEFATANEAILNSGEFGKTYAVYDPETDTWLQYGEKTSTGSNTASQFINMHQGFFIQTGTAEGTAQFTNDMRTNNPGENHPGFRGEQRPNYPLINFILTDANGDNDIAVLEVGRPENDGAKKIFVSSSTGRLYLRYDSEDFAILFRDMTKGSQPLYFDAKENGTFTLSWNTANANFQSLTLVDNIAGVKYDMLAHDSYTFEGNTDNYKSRFKVVIGEFTDVEENEEPVESNFAFFDGSEWVVNGQGQLDVVDMLGRTMLSERLTSDQNRVSLNGMAQGVYLMRVTNGNEVKVQKIVVR